VTDIEKLQKHGFITVGSWKRNETGQHSLDLNHEYGLLKNVIYAFTKGDSVQYIGKTNNKLSIRMSQYDNPEKSQRTNIKIRNAINDSSEDWRIFCFHIRKLTIPNGKIHNNILDLTPYLPISINIADGIESSFIKAYSPPLNKRR